MLSFVIVLLLFVGGSHSLIPACLIFGADECAEEDIDIPKDRSEMDRMCQQLTTEFKCLNNNAKKCDLEDSEEIQPLRDIISYLENDLCNPESHLYKAFSQSLKCFQSQLPAVRTHCTRDSTKEKMKELTRLLGNELSFGDMHGTDAGNECVDQLFTTACAMAVNENSCEQTTNYGSEETPRHVMTTVAIRFLDFNSFCPHDVLRQFPELVQAFRTSQANNPEKNVMAMVPSILD